MGEAGSELAAAAEDAEELRRFLEQHRALRVLPPGTRVRCELTGHELPCRLPALRAYTEGKKYRRLIAKGLPGQGGGEDGGGGGGEGEGGLFGPHLVPSASNPRQLFCRLTLRHINRIPAHVLRHVQGRRFQKALRSSELFQEKSPVDKESNHDFATDSDEEVAKPTAQNGCEGGSKAADMDPQMGTKRGKKQDGGLKKRFKSRNKRPKRFGKAFGGK
ncbi:hypothetical protein JD844_004553 [Phrynosoma platyrhinos]|uniref:Surfeit 2 n=1 Tax=Phrynosoma platyrhinos TaxID=52577 RepID=A0ABQ7SDF1_PHRPL|nr:hypothetical protein JD844_004553 [Phrynosoma platyrhinos]